MVTKKNLAIIIPFHKNIEMLRLSLFTLENTLHGERPSILIIGNNYNEEELDFDEDFFKYEIHKINKNLFWPGAVNYGATCTDKEYLLFCDPDLFYTDGWLEMLIECFNQHEKAGVVSAKIVNPLNNRIMDFGMGYNHFNTIHIGKGLPYNHPTAQMDRKVQAACGAVFLTPHKLFDKVNKIDTTMPYIYCDNDYSVKISDLGYETWVAGKSVVYHKGNTDEHNSKYEKFKYLREDSKAAFYSKNQNKIHIDIWDCFMYMHNWIKNMHFNFEYGYYLYNFCTLLDAEAYIELFPSLKINIINQKNITLGERDLSKINLCDYIPTRMIYSNVAFIYFVDDFTSLYDNHLYFELRDVSKDIVIDRQCNIVFASEIKNKVI